MAHQRNIIPSPGRPASGTHHQRSNVKGADDERYWPGTLMGFGVFFGLASLFTVAAWTLIDPGYLFRVFIGLCFIGSVLPYIRSSWLFGMERLEWFLFNLVAVGPIVTSLLLWANFLFHGPVIADDHMVANVEAGRTVLTYNFTDDHLADFPFARSVYRDWHPIVGKRIRITEAQGLFGVPVVLKKEATGSAL